jgi:hypothetical protein
VNNWEQAEPAWELADTVAPLLTGRDRTAVFATIGAGDSRRAIETMLSASADRGLPVPASLLDKLQN